MTEKKNTKKPVLKKVEKKKEEKPVKTVDEKVENKKTLTIKDDKKSVAIKKIVKDKSSIKPLKKEVNKHAIDSIYSIEENEMLKKINIPKELNIATKYKIFLDVFGNLLQVYHAAV